MIRRIFQLSAEGHGVKGIAKILNGDSAVSPRAQCGRSQSWAPTSVREVLYRDVYRGVMTWNRTRKRDQWGMKKQAPRPADDWLTMPAPTLQIVTDDMWKAVHTRLEAVRGVYLKATGGRPFGRPALGDPSKYLLTNLALCGCCGGPMKVRSRSHGTGRKHFYGCAGYHDRGRTVCTNGSDVPMTDANDVVVEALLDDILDESIIEDAVDEGLRLLQGDGVGEKLTAIDMRLATVNTERERLAAAIAAGGPLEGLLAALRTREQTRVTLEAERQALRAERRLEASDATRVRSELLALATSWRTVLSDDPMNARPIVTALLNGRVVITPMKHAKRRWILKGNGTIAGLFQMAIFPSGWRPFGMASPVCASWNQLDLWLRAVDGLRRAA